MSNNIRLAAIGRLDELPAPAVRELEDAMELTAENTGLHLNLALNYGGRAELVDAVNAILRESAGGARLERSPRSRFRPASTPPDSPIPTS